MDPTIEAARLIRELSLYQATEKALLQYATALATVEWRGQISVDDVRKAARELRVKPRHHREEKTNAEAEATEEAGTRRPLDIIPRVPK
jgi:hypothetical protein